MDNNHPLSNQLPVQLKKFNIAAFGLSFIWGIANKVWITLLVIPISILGSFFGLGIVTFVFLVYLGWNGNRLAWKAGKHQLPELQNFLDRQKKWTKATIVVLILSVIVGVLAAFVSTSK